MKKISYIILTILSFVQVGCDNADDLLNQYIKDGPIVYAGRIVNLNIKSGQEKLGISIFPAEDVNKSHCILRWNTASGTKDSISVDYVASNYNNTLESYYTVIDMPAIEGNVLIEAWNVDIFGNRSLMTNKGGYVYGQKYINTLLPSQVRFATASETLEFENRVGVVDNLVSYEQNNGQYTEEVKVVNTLALINAKSGGKVRSKTRYLINTNDIDTLVTANYLETVMP